VLFNAHLFPRATVINNHTGGHVSRARGMDEVTSKLPKESRLVKKPDHLVQGSMLPSIAEMER